MVVLVSDVTLQTSSPMVTRASDAMTDPFGLKFPPLIVITCVPDIVVGLTDATRGVKPRVQVKAHASSEQIAGVFPIKIVIGID